MIQLAASKRAEYENYLPFWRPAADAKAAQSSFFERLVADPSCIALVHDNDGEIDGFVIANVIAAPPVYDPGGKGCLIDDFVVSHPSLWPTVGIALLNAAEARARKAGAVFSITVCAHLDEPKRAALAAAGAYVGTEWHVRPISELGE